MFYPKLVFPIKLGRPFFYTNFVMTLDGKVAVKLPGYWPIGSKKDHEVLTELRAYADCLIHGGNLAREFGEVTVNSLVKPSFKSLRKRLGKGPILPYYVITQNPKKFENLRESPHVYLPHTRHGYHENLALLVVELKKKGYKHILVEGGPTLLGSFFKEGLMDEVFLTIAPKIFGSQEGKTLTLVEDILFSPQQIKILKLVSIKKIGDEVFLRYSLKI